MKKLIIVGAGGFGRETFNWAKDVEAVNNEWVVSGFLDSNLKALNRFKNYSPILGHPMKYQPNKDEVFVCAIGDTRSKLKICTQLEKAGANFINIIHPTAILGNNTRIGIGCIICPNVVITTDIIIRKHVILNVDASVGHDVVIDDGCTINVHTDIGGFAKLGKGVFMGSHSSVLPYARVSDFATVGAGSVVLRFVKPDETVFGVPAVKLRGIELLNKGKRMKLKSDELKKR